MLYTLVHNTVKLYQTDVLKVIQEFIESYRTNVNLKKNVLTPLDAARVRYGDAPAIIQSLTSTYDSKKRHVGRDPLISQL